jgi:hypothetical protein
MKNNNNYSMLQLLIALPILLIFLLILFVGHHWVLNYVLVSTDILAEELSIKQTGSILALILLYRGFSTKRSN